MRSLSWRESRCNFWTAKSNSGRSFSYRGLSLTGIALTKQEHAYHASRGRSLKQHQTSRLATIRFYSSFMSNYVPFYSIVIQYFKVTKRVFHHSLLQKTILTLLCGCCGNYNTYFPACHPCSLRYCACDVSSARLFDLFNIYIPRKSSEHGLSAKACLPSS